MLRKYDLEVYYNNKRIEGIQSFEVYIVDKDLLGVKIKRYKNLDIDYEDLELIEEDGYIIAEIVTDKYGEVYMNLDKPDRSITACSLTKEEKGE
jgi:hypothetical protein